MSLLSYKELCNLIDAGVITHALPENVNSASIDIRIGKKVLIEKCTLDSDSRLLELKTISLKNRNPLTVREHDLEREGPINLYPGEIMLAHSIEIFHLPNNLSAMFKLKSSCGRIFLEHMNAGWCDAGWHGSALTMELKNCTRSHIIQISFGDAIGQMVFFQHAMVPSDKSYAMRGKYNHDKHVSGMKPEIVFDDEQEEIAQQVFNETIRSPDLPQETERSIIVSNEDEGDSK